MKTTEDLKLTITIEEMENEILKFIELNNSNKCSVEFVYSPSEHLGIDLYIITHNPVHKNPFLFSKSWGVTEEDALKKACLMINKNKKTENSYTVTWEKIGGTTQNSYFSGKNMHEVLDKFFFQKNQEEYIIFNIKLNPIS